MIKTVKGKILAITLLMLVILSIITSVFAQESYNINKVLKKKGCDLQVAYFAEKINKDIKILETNAQDLAIVGKLFYTPPVQTHDILDIKVKENFENNELAIGGGIWFEPNTIDKKRKRFSSYSYHTKNGTIVDKNYGNVEYDYHNQNWYKEIKAELSSTKDIVWTEPYYDASGTKSLMTTAGAGIYYNKKLVGIATVDWKLDSITKVIATLRPTKNSFAIFADKNNDFILAASNIADDNDLFGKPLSSLNWYNENLKNKQCIKIDGVEHLSFVRNLDNNMVLIVNVPTDELFRNILIWYEITLTLLLILSFGVAGLMYFVLLKNINEPINYLINTAKKIGDGDLDLQMDIKEPKEFEHLANVFNKMTKDIQDYVENITKITADKERIQKELDIAKMIQKSVLPSTFPPYPNNKEFDIFASMTAAKEIGGDFYDFFFIDQNHFAYLVADVSGKGIPSALFMMTVKMMVKNYAKTGMELKELIEKINHEICKNNSQGFFVTMFLAITDLNTGKTNFVNAGHNPPLLKKVNGSFEYLSVKSNLVLGALDNIDYEVEELNMEKDDVILFYTDGVTEATNKEKTLYGENRLEQVVNNVYYAKNDIRTAVDDIKADVDKYSEEVEQADDITMLIFRYNGSEKEVEKLENNSDILSIAKTIYLPAQTTNWATVLHWLEEICDEGHISQENKMKLSLVFEEVFVNISNYAYPPKTGEVQIDFKFVDIDEIEMRFSDAGTPYNPLEKPDPDITLSAEERPIGGLGIYMVKNTVDEISYEYKDEKNVLTLRMKLK